jgi:hypothetical protein
MSVFVALEISIDKKLELNARESLLRATKLISANPRLLFVVLLLEGISQTFSDRLVVSHLQSLFSTYPPQQSN